jgi:hypothetical protein
MVIAEIHSNLDHSGVMILWKTVSLDIASCEAGFSYLA